MGRIEDAAMRAMQRGAERATGVTTGHLGAQVPIDTREAVSGDCSAKNDMEPDSRHEYFKRLDPLVDTFISGLHAIFEKMIREQTGWFNVVRENDKQIRELTQEVDELTEERRTLLRLLHKDEL